MTDGLLEGRYRLDRPLGGTMGEVHLATDVELGRRVVVKLLGRDAERQRFEREARAAASLAHPNIVNLYTYGEVAGRPYMVFEYLPGGTLEDRLAGNHPLPDPETERIARNLAAGLAHAHARGLVHRDLKPANVLFDEEGRAKIADFGIARLGDAGTLTEAGTLLGTAAYLSPEQAAGETATPASDVYSFGVILFLMLTGRLPFTGASAIELVAQHANSDPPAISDLREDAPARLESVAAAALAKDPRDRPPDGRALVAELAGELQEETTAALPVVDPPPPARHRRALPLALTASMLVLLAAAGLGFAVALTHTNSSPAQAPELTSVGSLGSGGTTDSSLGGSTGSDNTSTTGATTRGTTVATIGGRLTTRRSTTVASFPTTTEPPLTTDTTPATTAPATTAATTTGPVPGG